MDAHCIWQRTNAQINLLALYSLDSNDISTTLLAPCVLFEPPPASGGPLQRTAVIRLKQIISIGLFCVQWLAFLQNR